MANIKLKGLLTEAEDFKARSKETGKLVHFKSKDAYQAALKAGSHENPKAKKGEQPKVSAKPNDMFGGDYAKDRGGEPKSDGMETVKSIAASTGLRATAVAGWADENGVNLSKVSDALKSKKLKPMDFMTAVSGNPGNKYAKDIIAKYPQSSNNTNWMDDLDSIDTSDVKGKADPNADSFTSNDLYGATFKDPQTGKSITVGDAYEREDDSPAYQKAFAYVAKFDPDKEAVMGTQAYDDLQKKEPSPLPKKASQLDYKHSTYLEKSLSAETGLDFYTNTDDNTDAIMFNPKTTNNYPTYTLYFGGNDDYGKPDEFRVSLLSTYGNDPLNIGDGSIDKTFKSGDDAKKFMIAVAKKYKKELQMDDEDTNESTKLTTMIKK
jgi:hypothetical protein